MKRKVGLTFALAIWLLAVAAGVRQMGRYASTEGVPGNTPHVWPLKSRLEPAADMPTLVMLAHPQCTCTRASIGELEKIMTRSQGRVKAYVLFLRPPGVPANWETTDLWESATRIPGVSVLSDPDGKEAELFQAATSGQTALYASDGRLLFSGGITRSRGHLGDNAGSSAIVSLIGNELTAQPTTPVFGCALSSNVGGDQQGGADARK
jgi:hypothetical protein